MGTLVAMAYPTRIAANLADHTYVKCDTGGAAWGCWGGKTGGRILRQGPGSTNRANSIAQPDEKANIRCYLINGVCHQAANRILLPAGITVRGARGYSVSQALFGTYGRVGFWPCRSPFRQYPTVTGDLAACVRARRGKRRVKSMPRNDADRADYQFIRRELEIYRGGSQLLRKSARTASERRDARNLHVKLFMHMAEFNLGQMLDRPLERKLKEFRRSVESDRYEYERAYEAKEMPAREFAVAIDKMALSFQSKMANMLSALEYESLFELPPDEQVVLADPRIVKKLGRD